MKKEGLIILIILFCFSKISSAITISLDKLLNNKEIIVSIIGNKASTHYYEPITLEVFNNSNNEIRIPINIGDLFIPTDRTKQALVVTAPVNIILQSNQKNSFKIKGMCIEQNNSAGNEETIYTFKKGINDKLQKLANFIYTHNYQTSAAQYAVWCLTDNTDLNSIISADSIEENSLKQFMIKEFAFNYLPQKNNYKYNYYTPPNEKVGGNFEFTITHPNDIQIAMFDKNGILIRELYNQKNVSKGVHKLNFEYDSSVYDDNVYYFKLIANNEVIVDRKWDAGAMREKFKNELKKKENR